MPTLLALDPSFTATGWCVFDLATDDAVAAGVIRTAPPKGAAKKRGTVAEHDAARAMAIMEAVWQACLDYQPCLAVMETFMAVPRTRTMGTLSRAQQACLAAVWRYLDGLPLMVTVPACKHAACGKLSASKAEVEAAVRKRLPADWDALLEGVAPGKRENAFDAGAAYLAAYQEPAVAAMRAMAKRGGE